MTTLFLLIFLPELLRRGVLVDLREPDELVKVLLDEAGAVPAQVAPRGLGVRHHEVAHAIGGVLREKNEGNTEL